MRKAIVLIVLFLVSVISSEGQWHPPTKVKRISANNAAQVQQIETLDYDPLAAFALFLHSVYPDLDTYQGLASLQIGFGSGAFQTASVQFEFHPCRMSGVSSQPSTTPYCGATPPERPFFKAQFGFSRDQKRPFVLGYNARGSFISAKLEALRDQFKDKVYSDYDLRDKQRYWGTADALQFLHSNDAKFGPENQKQFIAFLPIQAIEQTTGCKLRPESAEFQIGGPRNPELEWTVHGVAAATKHHEEGECWAMFEPFEGRLTAGGF
jgi:hypothetical protein